MSSIIKVDTVQDIDGNNIINENANTITIGASGDTITIPSGATLANNGTATGFASIAWQSSIVTAATHTATAGQGLWLDTSSNAITLTLPASPSVGDQIIFTDYARNWATNAITLNLNSENFQGNATPVPVYDTNGESVDIVYSGSTKGWIPNSDGAVALETPQSYTTDFLVIAGGGAGGLGKETTSLEYAGGGGGAGGYRNSFSTETSGGGGSSESSLTLIPGTVYTITIGAGGAGTNTSTAATSGVDSSISGSGITTITSVGGGRGGGRFNSGSGATVHNSETGGSGGGGGTSLTGTAGNGSAGTANQGFTGGDGSPDVSNDIGGGGGGASAAGADGTAGGTGGTGGDGLSSSITGSAVTRSGGGGAGAASSAGAGGSGGGGAGSAGGDGGDGTANTGSGGGGTRTNGTSGNGGSGVIILTMLDAKYSGTTTGSPTVATGVSGQTVLTFTGSGSYTG
jgi:hypothetical protein